MRGEYRYKAIPYPVSQLASYAGAAELLTTAAATSVINPDTAATSAIQHLP